MGFEKSLQGRETLKGQGSCRPSYEAEIKTRPRKWWTEPRNVHSVIRSIGPKRYKEEQKWAESSMP